MVKEIHFGDEARRGLYSGIQKVVDAVGVTLGPLGKNVILEGSGGYYECIRDGVSIIRDIILEDPLENMGARVLKEASRRTNIAAGDGTTTSTILTGLLVKEGSRQITSGSSPVELKRGMDKAVKVAVESINNIKKQVTSDDDIKSVATISGANDEEIGEMIAGALSKIGHDGLINVVETLDDQTTLEIREGMKFDPGLASPSFMNELDASGNPTGKCVLDNPLVLLIDGDLNVLSPIAPILDGAVQNNKPVVIFANGYSKAVLEDLYKNASSGVLKVLPAFNPYAPLDAHKQLRLEDLAVVTGATIINPTTIDWTTVTGDVLGSAKQVSSDSGYSLVIANDGREELIADRVKKLEVIRDNEKAQNRKERLQEEIGRLNNGVARINVGAPTDHERRDKKLRIEDAVLATRSAVEEGIVPGGGTVQLRMAEAVAMSMGEFLGEERMGAEIVINALRSMPKIIADNSGIPGEVVAATLTKQTDKSIGFNARTGKYENMYESGVIDAAKVARCSLQNAASVAGQILLTESVILEKYDEKGKPSHITNEYS